MGEVFPGYLLRGAVCAAGVVPLHTQYGLERSGELILLLSSHSIQFLPTVIIMCTIITAMSTVYTYIDHINTISP